MAEMQPTTEILTRISKNSLNNKDEVFTRLFRYLLREDIWFEAYRNLYANNGASTKGVNDDTADGFSERKIQKITEQLKNGKFNPTPVRRTYIQKKNSNKMRPLGIPTFTDKLVQEAVRMILEAIYEPIFHECSHGFRPNRSCHTALKSLRMKFTGAKWFIEGDIKGCFDNINHDVLIGILNKKIKDARLIQLIQQFLKAGYLEDWIYHRTYSGTPQGGIISPILANIYLHELDKFVENLKEEFDKPSKEKYTPEYRKAKYQTEKARKAIRECDPQDYERKKQLIKNLKAVRSVQLKTPCKSQTDKKIQYIRYADDFILSVNGSCEECIEIKKKLSQYISEVLKMQLSDEKTLITHSSNHARFLGYDISVRKNAKIKSKNGGVSLRTLNNKVELLIPLKEKINRFMFDKGVIFQKKDGSLFPTHRSYMIHMSDLEIISTYNSELRGICNYYNLASNYCQLRYFAYLMEYSCLKTLAAKHNTKISKIIAKFKDGKGGWGIPYETKSGKKRCYFAKYSDCKDSKDGTDNISNAAVIYGYSRNTLEERLKAKVCELCGDTNAEYYEIHHVHKVKDLKGKNDWERAMIAKRRKTLVLCRNCHHKVHNQ